MKIGKLNPEDLENMVLDRLPVLSDDIICGPATGLDCAAIRYQDGQVVLSTDPITGASADIGSLAIHVSCNDIAAFGIRPKALLLVLIAPPAASRAEIEAVIDQAAATARQMGVSIVGGHTEVSDAVNRFVVTTTAIGFTGDSPLVRSNGAQPGDTLVMTKTGGLEGTAILAADQAARLGCRLTEDELAAARRLLEQISVVPEGVIGGELGVSAMHDATEGGILGAAWELAQASGLGLTIEPARIPLQPLTRRICAELAIDPLRLISSGSLLIATAEPDRLLARLAAAGILGTAIGRLTADPACWLLADGQQQPLDPPGPDELYKVV